MLISLKQSTNISHRKVNLIWQSHFQIIQICFIFDSYSCVTSSQVTVSPNTSQPPIPIAIPWILSLLYSTNIFKNKCRIRYIKNVPLPKYKFRDPMTGILFHPSALLFRLFNFNIIHRHPRSTTGKAQKPRDTMSVTVTSVLNAFELCHTPGQNLNLVQIKFGFKLWIREKYLNQM